MSQIVKVTLSTAGVDSGPFNIYQNTDGYVTPVATAISRTVMTTTGYDVTVDSLATTVKVLSTGVCDNYDLIPISATTTSTSTSTTTSTTTAVVLNWYKIENCFQPGEFYYSTSYPAGSFSVGSRVTTTGNVLEVWTVVQVYTVDPLGEDKLITTTGLTGCPEIVYITVEPYYDFGVTPGDKIRASWDTPSVVGQPIGFMGTLSRYPTPGCVGTPTTQVWTVSNNTAILLDSGTYNIQSSCAIIPGTSPESDAQLKITNLKIYTGATSRDGFGCPDDFSTAVLQANVTANNYGTYYRIKIGTVYYQIIGAFTCPL